jgi:hypothetical protein
MNNTITVDDFLALYEFNLSEKQIAQVTKLVAEKNFSFQILLGAKRDEIILETIKRINSNLSKSGEKRKPEWNDGWGENLRDFVASNFSKKSLIPKYYRPSQVKRWQGNYIFTESSTFEYDFFEVLRLIVFEAFINNAKEVYEFGCGSPHNLVALSHLFPEMNLHGCDWSQSAVTICELLRENSNMKIQGHLFDFFNPELNVKSKSENIFLTCGGLEQVGSDFGAFVNFILEESPERVVHLEPISELYADDSENLFDYLAKSYHESRNYLKGYLTHIQNLEKERLVEIEGVRRIPFGGQFHEGWTLIVWSPIKKVASN